MPVQAGRYLVPIPDGRVAGTVGTLCGAFFGLEEIETLSSGQGMPCLMCVLHQISATAPVVEPPMGSPDGEGLINGVVYQAWGWPVIQHRDQIRLSLDCDVSAIEIPILFSAEGGPITWVQPPRQHSLHLSREIDVFGALRTCSATSTCDHPSSAHGRH